MPRGWQTQLCASRSRQRSLEISYSPLDVPKQSSSHWAEIWIDSCASLVAMTTTRRHSACADQRQGLVPVEQIEQATQCLPTCAVEVRIVLHDAQCFIARLDDELSMNGRARDPVAGEAALPDAKHVALAT